MAESKGCRREAVGNGWVDGVIVSVIVVFWKKFKLENVQNPRSQNDRKPLVISDVLQKRTYYFARLIKQPLELEKKQNDMMEQHHFKKSATNYLSSFQCLLTIDSFLAILLCSLRKTVWIAVRPGCSLHRLSPAAKQCRFLVEILHSSSAVLGSRAGSRGLRMCRLVYFNLPGSIQSF